MKTILITGLDGSGKSTLFNRLEKISTSSKYSFLRVPVIDTNLLHRHKNLFQASLFINHLNELADKHNDSALKTVALFSSMVIFKQLSDEIRTEGTEFMFCERHPLIDTVVYAKFYAHKIPTVIPRSDFLDSTEKEYSTELNYLISFLPKSDITENPFYSLLNYIRERFFVQQKYGLNDLKSLYNIELPDKIYFLSANPEILAQRFADRKIREIHETQEVMRQLTPLYDVVLKQTPTEQEIIDANSYEKLDEAFEKIKTNYFLESFPP